MKTRESRKLDHIKYALALSDGPCATGFAQVHVVPNCLPEINRKQVSLETCLPGIGTLKHPLLLNAITGGAEEVTSINRQLGQIAKETGCALAAGSQYGAIKSGKYAESFKVLRRENPQGIIFANVSALASVEEGQKAVDMLEAQALQIHLNVAQELAMEEGDRDFTGYLKNIEAMVKNVSVPVIVKETGCGMAKAELKTLTGIGVQLVDLGGMGGTNFMAIEAARYKKANQELQYWGLPTAISLLWAQEVLTKEQGIIASGGIRSSMDVLKALILGAKAVGMAGNILKALTDGGVENATQEINTLNEKLRDFMVLVGCKKISQLTKVPVYFTGDVESARNQF